MVALNKPTESFDLQTFIAALNRKYKIPIEELWAISKNCKVQSAGALKKRIIEVK